MMTPSAEFQARVAQLALSVASQYGFALAGGHALIAHGIVNRPTTDVDLFTNTAIGIGTAAGPVSNVLRSAGLRVDQIHRDASLIYGLDDELVELDVGDGTFVVRVQLVRFERHNEPVMMALGPVLHLDDVVGTKVAALLTRVEARDFIDVAALQDRYSRDELVRLGRAADPDLTDDEFAEAMDRLDLTRDQRLAAYGLSPTDIALVRRRFTDWPRTTN
jgi:hypothetical protein